MFILFLITAIFPFLTLLVRTVSNQYEKSNVVTYDLLMNLFAHAKGKVRLLIVLTTSHAT